MVKSLPAMQENQVPSLVGEDPLEKEMTTYSSVLVWEIPWSVEPSRLQSMESQRVRHNLATKPPATTTDGSVVKNLPANAEDTRGI